MRLTAWIAGLVVLFVVAAAASGGCESSESGTPRPSPVASPPPPPSPSPSPLPARSGALSSAERSWLNDLASWMGSFDRRALDPIRNLSLSDIDGYHMRDEAAADRILRPMLELDQCSEQLQGRVGRPPTGQLKAVYMPIKLACERFESAADLMFRGIHNADAVLIRRATDELDSAYRFTAEARRELDKLG